MYLAAYPLQLPEIKRVISHYYDKIYDHNTILKDRFGVQERFIENFVPWINKGHMKFVGLKDFKYVYITNGITEAMTTVMFEHSLRPITQKGEYPGYFAQAKVFRESNIELRNMIKRKKKIRFIFEIKRILFRIKYKTGYHVAFLGVDGSGKTTQIKKLNYSNYSNLFRNKKNYHLYNLKNYKLNKKVQPYNKSYGYVLSFLKIIYLFLFFSKFYFIN